MSTTAEQIDALHAAVNGPDAASSDYDLNPGAEPPRNRVLRPAGVLVALAPGLHGLDVILTKRSSRLKHHPGQIAFPGGKLEDTDATVVEAALREAEEEVGLRPDRVEVLGTLPPHETVTSFLMTPVVGLVTGRFDPVAEPGEVEEIFTVPLAHVAEPRNFTIQFRRWRGTRRHYYTVPFGPYYIWGATARVLRVLADRMSR